MIEINKVNFTYENALNSDGVNNINLSIPKGQVLLLCGASGCGKTTITRLINTLIPNYYEGALSGEVRIDNQDISELELYELSPKIGSVFQNPKSQFYTVSTDTEIVFAPENLGLAKDTILKAFDKTVAEFKIENLLGKSLFELSGGEKQKIACACVSTLNPDIFILDEPSSNLDIKSMGELKNILANWKANGKTIIIAEHRLYWLKDIVDRVLYMESGKISKDISIEEFKNTPQSDLNALGLRSINGFKFSQNSQVNNNDSLTISGFSFSYGKTQVLDIPHLDVPKGAIVGIIGHNGAGKTTFARCLCGLEKKSKGNLVFDGVTYNYKKRIKLCSMVMQDVNHQLFTESVLDEIYLSMEKQNYDNAKREQIASEILDSLNLTQLKTAHPMSLSGGQKQRVAIGSSLASNKEIIVYDEPTSGLDYYHMIEVAKNIKQTSELGKTQFIITHDPELIAQCCNYFVYIDNGRVKWSGGWNKDNTTKIEEFFNS